MSKRKHEQGKRYQINFAARGEAGLDRQAGAISEEWLSEIQTLSDRVKIFREMRDNHPVIGGGLLVWELLIRGSKTTVEPTGDATEYIRAAEFVQSCIDDLDGGFGAFNADFAGGTLSQGFSLYEITHKIRRGMGVPVRSLRSKNYDGLIGWRSFSPRGQDTLTVGDEWVFNGDDILGINQSPAPDFEDRFIPISNLLHFKLSSEKNNPEGRSLLRSAYTSYIAQRAFAFYEGVGAARNLAGIPLITAPADVLSPNATPDKAAIRGYLEDIGRKVHLNDQAFVLMPPVEDRDGKTGYSFNLISASGKSNSDLDATIRRLDSRIAMSMMTEGMLLGADKTASLALAQDKRGMLAGGVDAVLNMRDEVFNTTAIPDLLKINAIDTRYTPRMTHSRVDAATMAEVAAYVSSMIGANVMQPDGKLDSYLREIGDLPQADKNTPLSTVVDIQKRKQPDFNFDEIIGEAIANGFN